MLIHIDPYSPVPQMSPTLMHAMSILSYNFSKVGVCFALHILAFGLICGTGEYIHYSACMHIYSRDAKLIKKFSQVDTFLKIIVKGYRFASDLSDTPSPQSRTGLLNFD